MPRATVRATIAHMNMEGAGRPGVSGRSVLLVDDSENALATLEVALLAIPGLAVLTASSGAEALRILEGAGAGIAAVITDLNMPRMDGYELIRRLRESQRLSATPILVISADTDPSTPGRVAQLGVSAYFAKPFSPGEVRRKLEQILDGTTQ
jgi:two-component system, chemotaxis family, chemotaxis protein CheY